MEKTGLSHTDLNNNKSKLSRSNSRLTSTLKKLLPRRKDPIKSELKVNAVTAGTKHTLHITGDDRNAHGQEQGNGINNIVKPNIGRNKSFLFSQKNEYNNNSSVPFTQKKTNRTIVNIGGITSESTHPVEPQVKIENKSSWTAEENPSFQDNQRRDTSTSHIKKTDERLPVREDQYNGDNNPVSFADQFSPSSPLVSAKVSRRAIIRRTDNQFDNSEHSEEEQWFSKEKILKDHIEEVLDKWSNIEDEIWAKVIILERNRRVAKAYARAPILTINGSDDGFDGFKIGVNGFDNPMRDHKVKEFKAQIGAGCKLKMGNNGDILVKRIGKGNIYIKNIIEETAVSNDILKLPMGLLELDHTLKLFDMKKFKQNVNRELKRQQPDRVKLETQCISTLAFVKNEGEVLDSPIWIMVINIVALEMLSSHIPKQNGMVLEIIFNNHITHLFLEAHNTQKR